VIAVPRALPPRPGGAAAVRLRALVAEQAIHAALASAFVVMTVVTWRKWGVPEVDAGAELTTAAQLADGAIPYRDIRYFYGPLGVYLLAGAFRLFGTSLTVAFGFGLLQAAAVLTTFHLLARRWLSPLGAGLATLVLLAIGFSGTAYNFVLPHTNSATIGLLCLLGMLLALSSRRPVAAGVLLGMAALTRPEFAAVALAAATAHLVGLRRDGDRTTLRAAVCICLPATAVGGGVLAAFAAVAGPERLFLENLWPVDFIREAGFATQSYWMPFTASSALALLARGAAYLGPLLAIVVALDRAARADGRRARARAAAAPLVIAGIGLAVLFGGWQLTGVAAADFEQVRSEITRLVVVMSWLPLLGLGAAAYAAWCFARRLEAPLTGSWAIDLPLLVAAGALGLRAYNAFTDERSYAPYYAAPMVLLLAVLHMRIAERRPAARAASLGALALCAAALAAYAVVGLYADDSSTVRSPRGTYVTNSSAGPGVQAALDGIRRASVDGEPILAAPGEGGLYFLSGRDPALYEVMLLPGLLDTVGDERDAIRRLEDRNVRVAVVGARDLSAYGRGTFGTDFNRVLGRHLAGAVSQRRVGELSNPVGGSYAARGYTILRLPR
jgi:hypothetical protein